MNKSFFFLALFFAYCLPSTAQGKPSETITALKNALAKSSNATGKADLLCKLALLYVYKPGEIANDLDSALLLTNQATAINLSLKDKAVEAKIYYVKSNALREKGDTTQGRGAITKALDIYKSIPPSAEHGDAFIELSRYYNIYSKEGCTKKKECYEQALAQFQAAGTKEQQADALKNLGDFNQLLRNYGLAIINLQSALTIYTSIGYKNLQGVYDLLGIVSTNMGDYSNAIKYGLLAVQTAENLNDTSVQLCTIYHRLGVAYSNWSKWEDAGLYEKKALAIAIKYHDKDAIETVLLNLTYMQILHRNWQEILALIISADKYTRPWNLEDSVYMSIFYSTTYTTGKNFNAAGKYSNILIDIMPRASKEPATLHVLTNCLVDYFLATKNYKTAKKYLAADLEYCIKYSNKRTIQNYYIKTARADSGMGNFRDALTNFQIFKILSDSMLMQPKVFNLHKCR